MSKVRSSYRMPWLALRSNAVLRGPSRRSISRLCVRIEDEPFRRRPRVLPGRASCLDQIVPRLAIETSSIQHALGRGGVVGGGAQQDGAHLIVSALGLTYVGHGIPHQAPSRGDVTADRGSPLDGIASRRRADAWCAGGRPREERYRTCSISRRLRSSSSSLAGNRSKRASAERYFIATLRPSI